MNEHTESNEPSMVMCEVCLKEIPRSEANSSEVEEYVMYFCGVDCYNQWQKGVDTRSDTE